MSKRRQNRPPGSKPKGSPGPKGQPPAATAPGEELGGGWRIGDTVGPPDWVGKPGGKPKTSPKAKTPQRTKPTITTVVEGQPVYAGVTFGTVGASITGGGAKRGWKRVTKDNKTINGRLVEYLIPNINRKGRFSGDPVYWRITEANLITVIKNARGTASQQNLALNAGELQSILEGSFKRQPKLYVDTFNEDPISAATGLAPDIRAQGYSEADGATLYYGTSRDKEIKGDDGLIGPIDPRQPAVKIPVPVPGEIVFEAPKADDQPRGTYYFDKGRFLTRGKYNAETLSRPTQRRG